MQSNVSLDGKAPFLVALKQKSDSKLICGGFLITNKHILTPAHCVHQKQVVEGLTPSMLEIQLGRKHVSTGSDKDFETRNVQKIFVNENYKYDSLKHDGDVAVLVMDQQVVFSPSVSPICLTPDTEVHKQVDGGVVSFYVQKAAKN